jgi:hypothetical protein
MDAGADFIPRRDGASALFAGVQVTFEFGGAQSVKFAVEIRMRYGLGLLTRQEWSPWGTCSFIVETVTGGILFPAAGEISKI